MDNSIERLDWSEVMENDGLECPFCQSLVMTEESIDPCEHTALVRTDLDDDLELMTFHDKYKHFHLALLNYKTDDEDFEGFSANEVAEIFSNHFRACGAKFVDVERHGMACGPICECTTFVFLKEV